MCRVDELCRKDVINVKDGCRLGFVSDMEIDALEGRVTALVILGRGRFFGLLGREDDIVIPWGDIQTIGEDAILVCIEPPCRRRSKPHSGPFNFFK